MEPNPYETPEAGLEQAGDPFYARDKVGPVSIVLIIATGVGLLYPLLNLPFAVGVVTGVIQPPDPTQFGLPPQSPQEAMLSSMMAIGLHGVQIVVGGLIIFGAYQMRTLRSHTMGVVAAALALIPCISPCCCTTLPVGVWALVVLFNRQVQEAFALNAEGRLPPTY